MSAPGMRSQLAAVCLRSWKRKSAIPAFRQARWNATLTCGGERGENPKSPWRSFQKWGPDESFGGIAGFTPDNRAVYLTSSVGANAARLLEVDLVSGQSKVVAEDSQFDVGGTMTHPTKHNLEAVQFVRERSEWTLIDKSLQADFDAVRQIHDGDFYVVSRDLADQTWIVTYSVDDGPSPFYAYSRASRKATLLFTDRPALEKYKLSKMQPISFKTRDGMAIYGYLILPAGLEPRHLPLVLNVHGGPRGRDTWGFNNEAEWLANRGYAVLQINFRGSAGYGKNYLNAGDREWAGKMHSDLIDGKDWAVRRGYVDANHVCIFGGSYGGYATLVGLSFTPDEFVCGVESFGPSNLPTLLKNMPPYWELIQSLIFKRLSPACLKDSGPSLRRHVVAVSRLGVRGPLDFARQLALALPLGSNLLSKQRRRRTRNSFALRQCMSRRLGRCFEAAERVPVAE